MRGLRVWIPKVRLPKIRLPEWRWFPFLVGWVLALFLGLKIASTVDRLFIDSCLQTNAELRDQIKEKDSLIGLFFAAFHGELPCNYKPPKKEQK